MKHQLRSGKLKSFLYFKYIVEKMEAKVHINNKLALLSLVVIASHLNPLGKKGNNLRYLNPVEQGYVINNIQPADIDTSDLDNNIKNFKSNALSLGFIHGLFDGDGSLSVSLLKMKNTLVKARPSFVIVQDIHNISLLNEVKMFFNDVGAVYEMSDKYALYKASDIKDLMYTILPIISGKHISSSNIASSYSLEKSFDSIDSSEISDLSLPLIKYDKIYYTAKMLKANLISINTESDLNHMISLSYKVFYNKHGISLEQYIEKIKKTLSKDHIIEDIV
jgi:hypothetical protein